MQDQDICLLMGCLNTGIGEGHLKSVWKQLFQIRHWVWKGHSLYNKFTDLNIETYLHRFSYFKAFDAKAICSQNRAAVSRHQSGFHIYLKS